jgi:arylsulfatase A-like enzyme
MRRIGSWLLAILLAMQVTGCGAPAPRPDILLVTLDTVRYDQTSLPDDGPATTPHLRRLAGEGVSFDLAYAPSPVTAPSHLSLFSGRYPVEHGVTANGLALPAALPVLAETLAHRGYETAAFVSSFVLARDFGWGRGFAHFDDEFRPESASVVASSWEGFPLAGGALDRRAGAVTDRALAFLAARGAASAPVFLWVHYFDPHTPYDPPAELAGAFPPAPGEEEDPLLDDLRRHRREILYTDREMGRLVAEAERRAAPHGLLLLVAGDHGEGFLEHGHVHHGLTIYEEALRVPLVVRWPGWIAGGRRESAPVSLVDVAPTVLGLLGASGQEPHGDGFDLAPYLRGGSGLAADRALFFQRRTFAPGATDELFDPPWRRRAVGDPIVGRQFGVRIGPWKYIEAREAGRRELFDLARDAGEQIDLSGAEPARADEMARLLRRFVAEREARTPAVRPPNEEERARLRALGYLP